MKQRDTLAAKLSNFVGAFDASEMTATEVAEYGVKKLGLKCTSGSEAAVLEGYLHNRPAPTDEVGYSLDSSRESNADNVLSFFTNAA